MKNLLSVFTLLMAGLLFGQDDPELTQFMTDYPTYISFKERDKLDPAINRHYDHLKKFLLSKNENIEDYYHGGLIITPAGSGGFLPNEPTISFPIIHIDTLRALLKFKKENPEKYRELYYWDTPYQVIGNASKKDGLVDIYENGNVSMTIWE